MKIIRIINWLSLVFAAALIASSLILAYVLLVPVNVITDWHLSTDRLAYHAGQPLTLESHYKKLRNVNGRASYYLECRNPNGNFVRYLMNQSAGNRPKGVGSIDIPLQLPTDVANMPLSCHIAVSVEYEVYTIRTFTENNISNDFEVKR